MDEGDIGGADFGVIAWHEDGRWELSELSDCRDLTRIIDQLKSQRTNGGAVALIAIDEEFFIAARSLGSHLQMMFGDVTYASDYDIAADLLDALFLHQSKDRVDQGLLGRMNCGARCHFFSCAHQRAMSRIRPRILLESREPRAAR